MQINEVLVNEGPLDWAASGIKRQATKLAKKGTFGDTKAKLQGSLDAQDQAQEWMKDFRADYVKKGVPQNLTSVLLYLKKQGVSDQSLSRAWESVKHEFPMYRDNLEMVDDIRQSKLSTLTKNMRKRKNKASESINEATSVSSDNVMMNDKMFFRKFLERVAQAHTKETAFGNDEEQTQDQPQQQTTTQQQTDQDQDGRPDDPEAWADQVLASVNGNERVAAALATALLTKVSKTGGIKARK